MKGGIDEGVSMSCPYHPPKKTQSAVGIGERGSRIRSSFERKGRGCDYHEVDNNDDDDDDDGKGGKGGKRGKKY